MQCVNCAFENIPGLSACARCGAQLQLAGVSVVPPRATALRLRTRAAQASHRVRRALPAVPLLRRLVTVLAVEPIPPRALLHALVPGGGLALMGRRRLGRVFLGVWLALLGLAIVLLGSGAAVFAATLMIATHTLAIAALLTPQLAWERLPVRLLFGPAIGLLLWLCLYQPAVWFLTRFATVVPVQRAPATGAVQSSDGFLVLGPWLHDGRYRRGDLVLFRYDPEDSEGGYVIGAGYGIDHIRALPGDHVAFDNKVLTVNAVGVPCVVNMASFARELRHREYFIPPESVGGFTGDTPNEMWLQFAQRLALVRQERLVGPVVWRLYPWSRFGRVD